jgi:hypothetical protein
VDAVEPGGRERAAALLVGPARVERQAAIEEELRPRPELGTGVEVVGARAMASSPCWAKAKVLPICQRLRPSPESQLRKPLWVQ